MGTSATAADARSAIQAGDRKFEEAFGRGDAASVAGLYAADAQLLPAHSDFVNGTAAIQRFWQGAMDAGIGGGALETLEVRTSGDIAYEVGRYTLRAKSGEVADAGKYVVIWKNDGGAWRLYRDIWTTSRPAP